MAALTGAETRLHPGVKHSLYMTDEIMFKSSHATLSQLKRRVKITPLTQVIQTTVTVAQQVGQRYYSREKLGYTN